MDTSLIWAYYLKINFGSILLIIFFGLFRFSTGYNMHPNYTDILSHTIKRYMEDMHEGWRTTCIHFIFQMTCRRHVSTKHFHSKYHLAYK